jgi:hypothetical protein
MNEFNQLIEALELLKANSDASPESKEVILDEAIALANKLRAEFACSNLIDFNHKKELSVDSPKFEFSREKKRTRDRTKPSPEFDRFWAAVQKRVDKAATQVEFSKVKGVDIDLLIARLEEQQVWHLKNNGSLKFLPNPANWLRRRRWEDELNFGSRYDSPIEYPPAQNIIELLNGQR